MEKDKKSINHNLSIITKAKNYLFGSQKRIIIFLVVLIVFGFIGWRTFGAQKQEPQYQTAAVEKGTLISSLSESGQATTANRISITTQASGTVSEVDVANGDSVTQGQKIAVINLDSAGQQKQAQAWASYLSAKSSFEKTNSDLYSLQSTMYTKWDAYKSLSENSTYQNGDGSPNTANRTLPQFTTAQDDWLAAEAAYKNQQSVIVQSQANLDSAWLSYQASSNAITAPMSGIISDLIITTGSQIGSSTSTTSSSGTSSSPQAIATIKTAGNPLIAVNLSEVDAAKVKSGQKATVTFDAIPSKSFTGKVLGINTSGTVSSGVTTYPAAIQLDLPNDEILPNMSATANIVLDVKNDTLLVPSSAVQTTGGQPSIQILKNGKIVLTPVEVGISSDTQTEILSGVNEGDSVITGFATLQNNQGSSTASPFSGGGFRMGGFGGGGGGARAGRGGG